MELIDQWPVPRQADLRRFASIQLLAGDLTALPSEHAVDALVVSAFPDSYTPNRGTLFASLYAKGLDMRDVAARKDEDERAHLGCWLSKLLPLRTRRKLHFDRVICFEPRYPEFVANARLDSRNPEDAVAFVFRCLNNFIIPSRSGKQRFKLSRLAMPLLATGNQGVSVDAILPRLLKAAAFWLERGLPVDELKIVAFSPHDVGISRRIFKKAKSTYRPSAQARNRHTITKRRTADSTEKLDPQVVLRRPANKAKVARARTTTETNVPPTGYDFFISYAHKQESEVTEFVRALRAAAPSARIFFDRTAIPTGELWIRALSDAIQKVKTFVAILSPDYSASLVCWDEFQCAKLKEYNTRQPLIKTVRLYSDANLPPIMGIHSYIDCVEGDLRKLRKAAYTLCP